MPDILKSTKWNDKQAIQPELGSEKYTTMSEKFRVTRFPKFKSTIDDEMDETSDESERKMMDTKRINLMEEPGYIEIFKNE